MKEAIQKAIEGGYEMPANWEVFGHNSGVLLDPPFWQALGKTEGWLGYYSLVIESNATEECLVRGNMPKWRYKMLSFTDHLAEGKDAESFFKDLIK